MKHNTTYKKPNAPLSNNQGSSLILVLVLSVIGSIVMSSFLFTTRMTHKLSGKQIAKVGALNIAEAGKEEFYGMLRSNKFQPIAHTTTTIFDRKPFGKGTYTVTCKTGNSPDTITILTKGVQRAESTMIEITALVTKEIPLSGFSSNVPGAIVARFDVELSGTITVDGRNFDSTNNHVGNGGYGVVTCTNLSFNGNADIGGNGIPPIRGKKDYFTGSPVALENAPITSRLSSPEAFLGVPAGALDKYKVSSLPTNFEGIYYLTDDFDNHDIGNSRGILIVHNSSKTATIKLNKGTFKGLIICDNVNKINGGLNLLGAIISLGVSTGNVFGNGGADIHYSQQVLDNLGEYCKNVPTKVKELSWRELR